MDQTHYQHFKNTLETMKAELLSSADAHLDATVELDQSRVGRLSRMDALQGQQMAMEVKRRSTAKLLAIESALKRIATETYGDCFVCDQPIPLKRLELDPTYTRCIECVDQ